MKKILLIAAVIGLIAIPSFVIARNDADDNKQSETSQEDSQTSQAEDSQTPEPQSASGEISEEEAIEIAKEEYPNQTVRKVEIESEDGAKLYSVRFSDDSRVDVRASDGQIVRNEIGESGGQGRTYPEGIY